MLRSHVARLGIGFAGRALAVAVATGVAVGAPLGARAAEPAPVEAVWQQHELDFTYVGFTSLYSCDGLEDKLRRLLVAAGARRDAKVSARGCELGRSAVSRMPRAKLVFHTLAPAPGGAPPAPAAAPAEPPPKQLGRDAPKLRKDPPPPVPAVGAWRAIEFRSRTPRWLEPGDCELVDQFQREVLPKFTTRDVVGGARCTPHQQSVLDIRLTFSVLAPLPDADVARSGSSPATGEPPATPPRSP